LRCSRQVTVSHPAAIVTLAFKFFQLALLGSCAAPAGIAG